MRSDDFLKTSTLTSRDTNRLTQCDPSAPQLWDLDSLTLNDTTQELYGELVVFGLVSFLDTLDNPPFGIC